MESNIKVTFWLRKTKKNEKNLVPVYLRVWYDYNYFTKGSGVWIRSQDWDKKSMRVNGATQEVFTFNAQLDLMKVKVLQIVNQLSLLGKPFNLNTIKKMLDGNETNQITLMRVCAEQIVEMEKLK
jgi:predicted ATPase